MPIDQWLTNPPENGKFRGWGQKRFAESKKGAFCGNPVLGIFAVEKGVPHVVIGGKCQKIRLEMNPDQVRYKAMELPHPLLHHAMRFCLTLAVLFASVGAPRPIVHNHQQFGMHAESAEHFEIHWEQFHQSESCQPTGPHCHWILGHSPIAGVTLCGDTDSFLCIMATVDSNFTQLQQLNFFPGSANWETAHRSADALAFRRHHLRTLEYALGPPWSTAATRVHVLLTRFTI